ncbi:MAG: HAD-IC family P-type ATPase, partial [Pseudomonadota bacterium]
DKTGTVTEGKPAVTDVTVMDGDKQTVLALLAAAEHGSEHHLGRAIVDHVRSLGIEAGQPSRFEAIAGKGVRARVGRHEVQAGNAALLDGIDLAPAARMADDLSARGRTPVFVAIDGRLAAVIGIADRPRPAAAAAIQALHDMGIRTVMVTGDVEATARHVAAEVGIPSVIAGASPARKQAIVAEFKELGEIVGMIGDGINDAPALAAADVGFAIGTGTDIAIESATVTLVGGDIAKVAEMVALSRKTMRVIRQNLVWAMGYNTVAIPGAAMGQLNPMVASMAMALSSVSVVANSLRLQRER